MDAHRIAITADPLGRGSISIDGIDLSMEVNGVTFVSGVGARARQTLLTVSLVAPVIDIEGEGEVRVSPAVHDTLIALGWTPPGLHAV